MTVITHLGQQKQCPRIQFTRNLSKRRLHLRKRELFLTPKNGLWHAKNPDKIGAFRPCIYNVTVRWCRKRGSNPHGIATTGFWVQHVCQFHHSGIFQFRCFRSKTLPGNRRPIEEAHRKMKQYCVVRKPDITGLCTIGTFLDEADFESRTSANSITPAKNAFILYQTKFILYSIFARWLLFIAMHIY